MATDLVYQLLQQPAPGAGAAAVSGAVGEPTTLSAFGFGIIRPFRRDEKNDFTNGGGKELVRSAVGQVLGTRAASESTMGELRWAPEFGSLLPLLRHRNNNPALQELARIQVLEAIQRWEPRMFITSFDVRSKQSKPGTNNEDTLEIVVGFRLQRKNPFNRDTRIQGEEDSVTIEL